MTAARSLAERIHQTMRAPVPVGDRELHTSVSIGITEVAPDADPDECLCPGRRRHVPGEAERPGPLRGLRRGRSGTSTRRESRLADELRVAHAKGELTLDYQPIFRLTGGRPSELVGMEALLRWDHPDLGSVPPGEFVPLLEQSRQIVPVGRWVLEEATYQCRDWQAQGFPDLTMSVNVSARQLQDPGFFDDVQDALDASGLDPGHLVLEVTESVLVVDIVQIGTMMQRVRELGVHLALDDFGTGYSSLLYLQGLPIDRLKIDRSFVSDLDAEDHDGTIIQTVVDLAHNLGITVVAEGVETPAELRAVGAIGCDEAQGFLLGRPAAGPSAHAGAHGPGVDPVDLTPLEGPGESARQAGEHSLLGARRGWGIRRTAGRTRRRPRGRAGGWRPPGTRRAPRPARRHRASARRSGPRRAGWRAAGRPPARRCGRGRRRRSSTTAATRRRPRWPGRCRAVGPRSARRPRASHRELRATPSSTARTRSARVVRSDRLWKPPRASAVVDRRALAGQPRGEQHPAAAGRAPSPPARSASSKVVVRAASVAGRGHGPGATRGPDRPTPGCWRPGRSPGRIPGTVAIWRMASVFFFGNGQLIQLVVRDGHVGLEGEHRAGARRRPSGGRGCRPPRPTPSGRPRSAATVGQHRRRPPSRSAPSGGSFAAGTPGRRTRTGS